jgi:uncharacterized protein (TIGR02466 family)
MNKIFFHFPTCIFFKENILLNELNLYKKEILDYFEKNKIKKTFEDSSLTNNSYFIDNNIFENNIFKNLINEIYSNCVYFCKQLGFSDKQISKYTIINIWANLINEFDYHSFHTHANAGSALISGVFYVEAPTNATLSFKNLYDNYYTPEYPDLTNELNTNQIRYSCIPGTMLLFRSNVLHGYSQHLSKTNKISIAFNFGLKIKNEI